MRKLFQPNKIRSEAPPSSQTSPRTLALHEIASLKADIDDGVADVEAGRIKSFDTKRIVARGKKLLAAH